MKVIEDAALWAQREKRSSQSNFYYYFYFTKKKKSYNLHTHPVLILQNYHKHISYSSPICSTLLCFASLLSQRGHLWIYQLLYMCAFPQQDSVVYVPCECDISLQWLPLAPSAMCLRDSTMRPDTSSCATSACPCDHNPDLREVKNRTGCILSASSKDRSCGKKIKRNHSLTRARL